MPWCPLTYKLMLARASQNRYKWHEAGKAGWTWGQVSAWTPSYSPASSTPLCPQAFPGWPIEWVTYPDSNTLWQRDLETDVSCHWHGADEEMVSHAHAVYLSARTEGGREGGRVDAWLEMLEEERRSGGGCGWRRLWRVVKGEINQVRAICGNGCCSVIRNPITQQLLWAVSRRRLTAGQMRMLIFFSLPNLSPTRETF